MSDPIPTVLGRDSKLAKAARPLLERADVVDGRVVSDLERLDRQLTDLRRRADELVDEARSEADAIRDQARQEGRQEGLQECMEKLAAARAEYETVRERAEKDMVQLAFHIAQRLLDQVIELDPRVVRNIVGEALTAARGRREIVVIVNPEDQKILEQSRDEFARQLDGIPVYFEADSELGRGDCFIETEAGRIDARLETQLEVLRDSLMEL